ncbi:sigma-70 family RNA polymerase sigma factor [Endomicrobium sp. AH-315-J14]|nr:sigma-70 family RNA polymerase sigma factor [Endomicrobium sp. AH-315-J14]
MPDLNLQTRPPRAVEEQLVRKALPLLDSEARRLCRRLGGSIAHDELVSLGHPVVLDLVRAFDPRQSRFEPYMQVKLRWRLLDALRRMTHHRSVAARAHALAVSDAVGGDARAKVLESGGSRTDDEHQARLRGILGRHAAAMAVGWMSAGTAGEDSAADPADNPEQIAVRRSALRRLRQAVSELSDERARVLIERHYFGGERFDVIAADLGISKSRASRIHSQAIGCLHAIFQESQL